MELRNSFFIVFFSVFEFANGLIKDGLFCPLPKDLGVSGTEPIYVIIINGLQITEHEIIGQVEKTTPKPFSDYRYNDLRLEPGESKFLTYVTLNPGNKTRFNATLQNIGNKTLCYSITKQIGTQKNGNDEIVFDETCVSRCLNLDPTEKLLRKVDYGQVIYGNSSSLWITYTSSLVFKPVFRCPMPKQLMITNGTESINLDVKVKLTIFDSVKKPDDFRSLSNVVVQTFDWELKPGDTKYIPNLYYDGKVPYDATFHFTGDVLCYALVEIQVFSFTNSAKHYKERCKTGCIKINKESINWNYIGYASQSKGSSEFSRSSNFYLYFEPYFITECYRFNYYGNGDIDYEKIRAQFKKNPKDGAELVTCEKNERCKFVHKKYENSANLHRFFFGCENDRNVKTPQTECNRTCSPQYGEFYTCKYTLCSACCNTNKCNAFDKMVGSASQIMSPLTLIIAMNILFYFCCK